MTKFELLHDYESDNEPYSPYIFLEKGTIVEFRDYTWDGRVLVYHEDSGEFEVSEEWLGIHKSQKLDDDIPF